MARTLVKSGGGSNTTKLTITLTSSDGVGLQGQHIVLEELVSGIVAAEFDYTGQPETLKMPAGVSYKVIADEKIGYVVPEPVSIFAMDDPTVVVNYQRCVRYGFRRAKKNSAPDGRITYLYEAVGKTAFTMNLTTGTPNYGDWGDFINDIATPVMLNYDGTEAYELDKSDQTKKADGSDSDVANTAFAGNAMVRFGGKYKWVHRSEDADYEYVVFADGRFDETYHAYAHTDKDGVVKDRFYYGMYKGSYSNSRLRSIAGQTIMVSQTRTVEVDRAVANGDGYDTIYKSAWEYIADLLTLISKSDNSQAVFGNGRCASNNTAAIATGTTKTYGGFWGSSNQTSDVKVFWIEGFWGNVWEGMRGLINDKGTVKTKMTPPYNFDGAGYHNTGKVMSGTSGGYISTASVTDEAGFVPYTASGSATTYYCDGLWFNNSQVNYALVGGHWTYALLCGSRYVTLASAPSHASTHLGSRLSYIP